MKDIVIAAGYATRLGELTKTRLGAVCDLLFGNDPCWCGSGKKYKHCHGKVVGLLFVGK